MTPAKLTFGSERQRVEAFFTDRIFADAKCGCPDKKHDSY